MNEQMLVWTLTVAVLVLSFVWTAYEKWQASCKAEEERRLRERCDFKFDVDRAYVYDFEEFDDAV